MKKSSLWEFVFSTVPGEASLEQDGNQELRKEIIKSPAFFVDENGNNKVLVWYTAGKELLMKPMNNKKYMSRLWLLWMFGCDGSSCFERSSSVPGSDAAFKEGGRYIMTCKGCLP